MNPQIITFIYSSFFRKKADLPFVNAREALKNFLYQHNHGGPSGGGMTRFANFLGLEREKLASPNAGSVKGGWFSKNKFAVHGDVQGVEGLQFTQLGTPDEDELPLQFPGWFEAGTQQHTSPQFIPQGSARCRKAVTNTGAVRRPEKLSAYPKTHNLLI
jgi:hypothetical protein